MFHTLTFLCAASVLSAMWYSLRVHKDSLHPVVITGPMMLFLYVILPLYLEGRGDLAVYLHEDDLVYVQVLNLLGCAALCSGMLIGGTSGPQRAVQPWFLSPITARRLTNGALLLGLLGVAGFVANIASVGGVEAAYGRAYGGGWSDSGYVRESMLLTMPALQWLLSPRPGRKLVSLETALTLVIAIPLAMHGALGARRGPLFMSLAGPAVAWYLSRGRRPRAWVVLVGGALVGVLLLALVANRTSIYLGSDLDLEKKPTAYLHGGTGNEFIYGTGVVVDAATREQFLWGARYFVIIFVRPIPRSLWPDKYFDASRIFGIPNLEENLGMGHDLSNTMGWDAAVGAAPGVIADMFVEFWWGAIPVLFVIGWAYGRSWRKSLSRNGYWVAAYGIMASLSLYLILQTLEAMLFRCLLMCVPAWLVWASSHRRITSRNGHVTIRKLNPELKLEGSN